MEQKPDPLEVQSWLEWAGKQILSIEVKGTKPDSYRSFWPDYPDDRITAYGYSNERLKPARPNSYEVQTMDEILNLILIVPIPLTRRILNARSLVNPINNRYIYSWSRIAMVVSLERRAVKLQHWTGLDFISKHADEKVVGRLRFLLTSPPG